MGASRKTGPDPLVSGADIQHRTGFAADTLRDPPGTQQPLRMEWSPRHPLQAPTPSPHFSSPRLYVSEVICSDTRPMRKMITDALKSSVLMLVNLPTVRKV